MAIRSMIYGLLFVGALLGSIATIALVNSKPPSVAIFGTSPMPALAK